MEGQRRPGAFRGHERKRAAHVQRFPPDPSRAADRAERHCGAQQRRAAELARHAVLQHGQLDIRNDHRRKLPLPADRTAGGLVAAADHRGAWPGDDQGRPGDDEPWSPGAVHPQRAEHRQYRRVKRNNRGQAADADAGRQSYTCTLSNGTPGVMDCQDAHTVTAVIPLVTITKQVTVVGGGPAAPGTTLDYLVHVTNSSANPVNPMVITDNLNAAGAGALTYLAGTATMNGSPNGVSVAGNVITANYSATYVPLAPAGTIDPRFRSTLSSALAARTIITNNGVLTWITLAQQASAR